MDYCIEQRKLQDFVIILCLCGIRLDEVLVVHLVLVELYENLSLNKIITMCHFGFYARLAKLSSYLLLLQSSYFWVLSLGIKFIPRAENPNQKNVFPKNRIYLLETILKSSAGNLIQSYQIHLVWLRYWKRSNLIKIVFCSQSTSKACIPIFKLIMPLN